MDMRQLSKVKLCRRAQKLFFGTHLSRWGMAFARNLRDATRLTFYQGIRQFLELLLLAETKYLKVPPSDLSSGTDTPETRGSSRTACSQCSSASNHTPSELPATSGSQQLNQFNRPDAKVLDSIKVET